MTSSIQVRNSRLHVVINYKDEKGKRKQKWVSTGLKEGAGKRRVEEIRKKIVAEFEEEYNQKLYSQKNPVTSNARYTFVDFMDMWLETIKPTIAHSTYIGYAKNCRRIRNYFESKNIMLDELKPMHIQEFYSKMFDEGLTGNTVLHFHANIKKALKYAVKNELIFTNPADNVDRPKCEKFIGGYYSKVELEKLFEIFKGDRMELCVHIAAYYGLRRSEVIGLKWDAIDFENKTLTVKHKVIGEYGSGKEIIIAEDKLKNSSSRRILPLIPHIEKMLIAEKERQEYYSELLKTGYDKEYEGYICRDSLGRLITPNYVTDHFRTMIKKHGLRKIRFHDLRHSCASLLLANGISMKEIQEWLGHSSYNTTANIYSHLDYESKQASAETISNVLG